MRYASADSSSGGGFPAGREHSARVAFNPMALVAGFFYPLKRSHPNPDELDWGESGARGIRTLGEVTPTLP